MLTSLPDPYTESWPNTIAICAIMFNETARDVKEFIDYYRSVSGGMQKFRPLGQGPRLSHVPQRISDARCCRPKAAQA